MKLFDHIERLNRLNELIEHKRTGTPEELAHRLQLSVAMIYKLMEELRWRGAPIEYSRELRSYYYSTKFSMRITVEWEFINSKDLIAINGGSYISCYQEMEYFLKNKLIAG